MREEVAGVEEAVEVVEVVEGAYNLGQFFTALVSSQTPFSQLVSPVQRKQFLESAHESAKILWYPLLESFVKGEHKQHTVHHHRY